MRLLFTLLTNHRVAFSRAIYERLPDGAEELRKHNTRQLRNPWPSDRRRDTKLGQVDNLQPGCVN